MGKKIIPFSDKINSIEIRLGDYPILAELKKQEFMEEGLSEEEATKEANECRIDLELLYHKGNGLFGVETGAIECCLMGGLYSPYDGETELIDEEYIDNKTTKKEVIYLLYETKGCDEADETEIISAFKNKEDALRALLEYRNDFVTTHGADWIIAKRNPRKWMIYDEPEHFQLCNNDPLLGFNYKLHIEEREIV